METANPLFAVQHVRKMRGGSQAHLLRASDNNFYVTKFKNNPQSTRVLASEFIGTRIGIHLGLPMPEVRVIEVSEGLIKETPQLNIESESARIPCTSGLQLASRYIVEPAQGPAFDYMPDTMFDRIANRQDFARVLVFDKWTGNCDGRQMVFVRQPQSRLYQMTFIDQGHCFNADQWAFPDHPLHGTYCRNSVYSSVTGWDSFEPTLSRVEAIELPTLWKLAEGMPEEWWKEDDDDALAHLLESLYARRLSVRDLISAFHHTTNNPFPNWIGNQTVHLQEK